MKAENSDTDTIIMVNFELTKPAPPTRQSARRALLLRRKTQIESQLDALDARAKLAARKRETRRKIIVGAAVLAHAKLDPGFAAKLHEVLSVAVTRPADRAAISEQSR